jgi:hypothetical protein
MWGRDVDVASAPTSSSGTIPSRSHLALIWPNVTYKKYYTSQNLNPLYQSMSLRIMLLGHSGEEEEMGCCGFKNGEAEDSVGQYADGGWN